MLYHSALITIMSLTHWEGMALDVCEFIYA